MPGFLVRRLGRPRRGVPLCSLFLCSRCTSRPDSNYHAITERNVSDLLSRAFRFSLTLTGYLVVLEPRRLRARMVESFDLKWQDHQ